MRRQAVSPKGEMQGSGTGWHTPAQRVAWRGVVIGRVCWISSPEFISCLDSKQRSTPFTLVREAIVLSLA